MFTFIILFTFIEACLDQSASEGQRKIAIFQYKLVIIAPCFYFPPKDQTFSGVSPLTASLSSQNILL